MITSSPLSRKAVKTAYWPVASSQILAVMYQWSRYTFVSATCDQNLGFYVEIATKVSFIKALDGLAQPDTAFGMRVMICLNCMQSFDGCISDPTRRGKVHIALPEIDTILGQISCTIGTLLTDIEDMGDHDSLENRPDILSECAAFFQARREWNQVST